MLVGINVLNGLVMFLRGKWTAQASESIAEKMRNRLYRHLQTLPYDYHVKAATGDLIQRCTSDVETVRRFLSGQLVEIFRAVFMLVIALVIMLNMNVKMTLVSLMLVPILFLYGMVFFKLTMKRFRETDEAEGRMSAVLQENLTGVRVVRAFGREKYEVEKFDKVNDNFRNLAAHQANLLAYYWSISDLLTMMQTAISLIYGVILAARGEISVGDLLVFTSYVGQLHLAGTSAGSNTVRHGQVVRGAGSYRRNTLPEERGEFTRHAASVAGGRHRVRSRGLRLRAR